MAGDPLPVLILNTGSSTFKWALLSDDEQFVGTGSEEWEAEDALTRKAQIEATAPRDPTVQGGGASHRAWRPRRSRTRSSSTTRFGASWKPCSRWICSTCARRCVRWMRARDAFPQALPRRRVRHGVPSHAEQGRRGLRVADGVDAALGPAPFRISRPQRLVERRLGAAEPAAVSREGSWSRTSAADARSPRCWTGRSIDTSMGFTPLEGLMMGTRAGSVDPGLLLHLQTHLGVTALELEDVLTNRSACSAYQASRADMREVQKAADAGNSNAWLARTTDSSSARDAPSAPPAGVLGGIDALVFTGGIGEHNPRVRRDIAAAPSRAWRSMRVPRRRRPDLFDRQSRARGCRVKAREDLVLLREVQRLEKLSAT